MGANHLFGEWYAFAHGDLLRFYVDMPDGQHPISNGQMVCYIRNATPQLAQRCQDLRRGAHYFVIPS